MSWLIRPYSMPTLIMPSRRLYTPVFSYSSGIANRNGVSWVVRYMTPRSPSHDIACQLCAPNAPGWIHCGFSS